MQHGLVAQHTHGTKSFTRGSNIWMGHALQDSLVADWKQVGDYRQRQTDYNNAHENSKCVDFDYKFGDKVLIKKDGILCKAEST
jgi:hypothetical protein